MDDQRATITGAPTIIGQIRNRGGAVDVLELLAKVELIKSKKAGGAMSKDGTKQRKRGKKRRSYRQFSDAEKSAALAKLAANCRDFKQTAQIANVPEYLLRRWAVGNGVSVPVFVEFVRRQSAALEQAAGVGRDGLKTFCSQMDFSLLGERLSAYVLK